MQIRNALLAAGASLLGIIPVAAYAQTAGDAPASTQATRSSLPPVTLDVKDAPIRQVLEQLFNTAKVDYSIDNGIVGYVTMRVTEQPFDSALRLILRSSLLPLSYTVDSGVYVVKPRPAAAAVSQTFAPAPPARQTLASRGATDGPKFEVIQLTYIDPADLAQVLGITTIPTFSRQLGNQGGGFGAGRNTTGFGGTGILGLGGFASDGLNGGSIFGNLRPGTGYNSAPSGYGNYTPGAQGTPGASGTGTTGNNP